MILKIGSYGDDVRALQVQLAASGFSAGHIDGAFGPKTETAVRAFQAARGLNVTGVVDAPTWSALLERLPATPARPTAAPNTTNDATWLAFEALVDRVTSRPVRYGPGRGLWHDGKFVITYGPGALGGSAKTWPNVLGKRYPSFHCTSWTNFFLGWLLRRNEDYTHAGNIPSLFDLLGKDSSVHRIDGGGSYRGYGDAVTPIAPNGSGAERSGVPRVMDAREIFDRRAELPTFLVCGQSTKRSSGWNWWHHTVLFAVRDNRLYRIAADGYKGSRGYSADPMRWVEITDKNVGTYGAAVYRAYGVNTADGTYGDTARPIAEVGFEEP